MTTEYDYITEANKFLQDGFFASALGDLMPPAMPGYCIGSFIGYYYHKPSDVLQPTIWFHRKSYLPDLPSDPSGPGHYDAAIYSLSKGNASGSICSVEPVTVIYRCGVNKPNQGKPCSLNPIYATRCKCFNHLKPCSPSCLCKDCSNPFGTKPPKPGPLAKEPFTSRSSLYSQVA